MMEENKKVIEIGKMYKDYTKEELALLPQLPAHIVNSGKNVPFMWDGQNWCWVMID